MKRIKKVESSVTREEKDCLQDLAESYDMSMSNFLRMLIKDKLEEEGYID